MDMDELLERVLSLSEPWTVSSAELDERNKSVDAYVTCESSTGPCPKCGELSKRHDS